MIEKKASATPVLPRPRLRPNRILAFLVLVTVTPIALWPTGLDGELAGASTVKTVLFTATGVLVGAWYLLYGVFKRRAQIALNDRAALLATGAEPFVLYLRPFVTTGHLLVPNSLPNFADRLLLGRWWDLELALALALEDMMPMVAIGETRHTFGAAKVKVSDSAWKDRFLELANNAKLIVMVPSERPGTAWELETIERDLALRAKSLLVMPPAQVTLRRLLSPHRWFSEARMWRRASIHLKEKHDITLPRYDRRGGFFVLGVKGEPIAFWLPGDFNDDYVAMICRMVMAGSDSSIPAGRREDQLSFLSDSVQRVKRLEPESLWRTWSWPLISLLFVLPFVFLVFRTVLFQPFTIPSGSMKPTLEVGDFMLASKSAYGYNQFSVPFPIPLLKDRIFASPPQRGDLAVFKSPRDNSTDYVKRIIGLPGDEIVLRNGTIILNGTAVPQVAAGTYTTLDDDGNAYEVPMFTEKLPDGTVYRILDTEKDGPFDNVGPYTVPEGHYFVLGDNRDNSTDSRAMWGMGFIPDQNIYARADLILFSRTEEEVPRWRKDRTLSPLR